MLVLCQTAFSGLDDRSSPRPLVQAADFQLGSIFALETGSIYRWVLSTIYLWPFITGTNGLKTGKKSGLLRVREEYQADPDKENHEERMPMWAWPARRCRRWLSRRRRARGGGVAGGECAAVGGGVDDGPAGRCAGGRSAVGAGGDGVATGGAVGRGVAAR